MNCNRVMLVGLGQRGHLWVEGNLGDRNLDLVGIVGLGQSWIDLVCSRRGKESGMGFGMCQGS